MGGLAGGAGGLGEGAAEEGVVTGSTDMDVDAAGAEGPKGTKAKKKRRQKNKKRGGSHHGKGLPS